MTPTPNDLAHTKLRAVESKTGLREKQLDAAIREIDYAMSHFQAAGYEDSVAAHLTDLAITITQEDQ